MKVLTIAATEQELTGLASILPEKYKSLVEFEITGLGGIATTFHLTKLLLTTKYDYVIQAGIAGSFDQELTPGTVCQVHTELLGDLGSEEVDGTTITQFELGLTLNDEFPYKEKTLKNDNNIELKDLKSVKSSTVNRSLGSKQSIEQFIHKHPDVQTESLEGGALFYVCLSLNVKFVELRSISNMVEPRNRENWDIPLAIYNLNSMYLKVIETLLN